MTSPRPDAEALRLRPWLAHYDDGVPAQIEFSGETVVGMFRRSVERRPEREALVFMNRSMTYRELAERVDAFAASLEGLGVGRDSRVAVHLPNLPQTVIAVMATLSLGAQVVMTNPLYVPRELEHQWTDAEVHVAVTGGWLYAKTIRELRARLPAKHYVIAHLPDYLGFPLNLLAPFKLKKKGLHAKVPLGANVHSFKKLAAGRAKPRARDVAGLDDLALLQYTGGTTGPAKGVMLTHRNLACQVQQLDAWLPQCKTENEVVLGALPYFHVFGFVCSLLYPLANGATIVIMANPRDVPLMVSLVAKHRVTMLPAVPALYNSMNNFPGIEQFDISCVKACVSGSAPLPLDTLQRFEQLTGSTIVEGFGMTECSPCTHCNPMGGSRKLGSIGIPLPNTDARVVDADDPTKEMPRGEAGELIVRGPQVMRGYLGRPEATAEAIQDGWMHTGDLAVMDEDGYFSIVGRKKDMILASGYNIYPDEIDRVLTDHPAVFEACTIGVPHERRGETVKSFIVLNPGATCTAEEIVAHCRAELAAYKVPKSIEFRDSLPKSSMMKLLRRELRLEEIARLKSTGDGDSDADA